MLIKTVKTISCLSLLLGTFFAGSAFAEKCAGSEVIGGPCSECTPRGEVGICDPNMNCVRCMPPDATKK